MARILNRIRKAFMGTDVDAILLMNTLAPTSNFLYLTGMTSGLFEFSPLVVTRRREVLLTNPLEYEIARRQHPAEMEVRNMGAKKASELFTELGEYLEGKRVGIDGESLPQKYYLLLKRYSKARAFVDVSGSFYAARAVKDDYEISMISRANHLVLKMMGEIQSYFKEGMTEKQLAAQVEYMMRAYGADGPSFPTIVCFGENAALPHHMPTAARLRRNSLVLIDCGAKYANYCSDVTRTFIFKPDAATAKHREMRQMLDTVKEAQGLAMGSIRAGLPGKSAHLVAAEYIDGACGGKYRGRFIHSLGHSLGIDVHDVGPRLGPSVTEKLQANMVVSDEPGIYVPGFGGVRIEDDVVVTKSGGRLI